MPPRPLKWNKPHMIGLNHDATQMPSPRSGYSLTLVGVNGYLFGGLDSSTVPPQASDGFYVVRISDDVCEWKRFNSEQSDEWPLARWRHTATQINATTILMFGGFHSHDERLNDCWLFDTITLTWAKYELGVSEAEENHKRKRGGRDIKDVYHLPLQEVISKDIPCPRGGHTATMVGEHMYLFGGYGGYGYARRELDDLHCLDISTMLWREITNAKGFPPDKRSGHQACCIQSSLVISGGKNSETEFRDIHVLDLEADPPVWSNYYEGLPECRWNFACRSFMAMPKWRMFVFGGKGRPEGGWGGRQDEDYLNDVLIVDTESFNVVNVDVKGDPPPPRADMEMVFDAKHGQMVIFSGYGVEWMNDIYFLDISSMVGPAYSLKDLFPRMGPVTGGTALDILGLDFPNSTDVTVRFEWEKTKAFMDIDGVFESQTKLTCITPDLSTYRGSVELGQGNCKIRVALDGDSFTLTTAEFYFHSVTDANKSLLFGPGVLENVRDPENNILASLEETMFVIQAKDTTGKNRTTGGDEFSVSIKLKVFEEGSDEITFRPVHGISIEDNEDGTYLVRYTAPEAGSYIVECTFNGTFGGPSGPLRGTPLMVIFDDFAPRANNQFTGKLMLSALKKEVDYLGMFTSSTLEGLSQPIEETDKRLEPGSWTEEREMHALAEVKALILGVQDSEEATDTLLARCKSMITYMKKIGRNVGPMVGTLKQASADWKAIFELLSGLEEKMKPLLKKNGVKIRAQISTYRETLVEFKEEAELGEGYKEYKTGWVAALGNIEALLKRCEEEQQKCDKMLVLANAFNCPREMGEAMQVLAAVKVILEDFEALWQVDKEVRVLMEMATEMLWTDLDPSGLDALGSSVLKKAKKCPLETATSDAYRGLQEFARNFFVVCPLVASFKRPSFKDRHWKELWGIAIPNDDPPEYIRTNYKYPDQNPDFLIFEFFNFLALHKHASLIEALILKAECEMNHELIVDAIEKRWAGIQFKPKDEDEAEDAKLKAMSKEAQRKSKAKAAKMSYLLPILTLTESDFEKLRNDQVALMDILKSSFGRYHGISQTWISRLESISTVVALAKLNRESSSFLYPLFTKSEEVKRSLPKAAGRFAAVYEEQKNSSLSMIQSTSACAACTGWQPLNIGRKEDATQGDMVAEFEKHATILEKCQRDLRIYADAKRCDFPRFFFLSNKELLDILANGTDPVIVIRHLPKIMLEMDTLQFTPTPEPSHGDSVKQSSAASLGSAGSGSVVTMLGHTAAFTGFGNEVVPFATDSGALEPLKLEGTVEMYLQTVLKASENLVHSSLDLSMQHFPLSTKLEWLMEKQKYIGTPLAPGETVNPDHVEMVPKYCGQVAVFVANIFNVRTCQEAMASFDSGVSNAFITMREQHVFDLGELTKLVRANLSTLDRTRVGNELVIDVFWRDAMALITKHELVDQNSFIWQSYLKPEYIPALVEDGNDAASVTSTLSMVKQEVEKPKSIVRHSAFGIQINYGYQSGAHPLPVCTPSTDKTCLALLRAINGAEGSGVAVLGEQGSGKTTLVDSVCRTVGRQYYPLGCTSSLLPSTVESVVTACAASGCMLLLNNPSALCDSARAALTHALCTVFAAVNAATDDDDVPSATLMNSSVALPRGFVCIAEGTFYRPVNGGQAHGGRLPFAGGSGGTGLPDMIRNRFRPVTVAPPDLDAILSVQLMREGFVKFEDLAPKLRVVVEAFPCVVGTTPALTLGSGLGSWGLSTLAPFITALGLLKRTSPEVAEPRLVLEVIKGLLLCQLHDKDRQAATMFLRDLFRFGKADPEDDNQIVRDNRFNEVIHQVSEDLGFWPQDMVSENVSRLNELIEMRTATVLCGAPGTGKSTVLQILEAVRNFVKSEEDAELPDDGDDPPVFDAPTKVVMLPVNALRLDEMFGSFSDETQSTNTDPGYLSKVLREITTAYKRKKRPTILVLDGDICSSGWAEAFLHLLSCAENKTEAPINVTFLDRMQLRLPENLRVVFEVSQMRSMTPALAARASLLYLEDKDGYLWRCVMARWIASRPDATYGDAVKEWLGDMFETYVPACLRWLNKAKDEHCPENVSLVTTCFRYLGDFLEEFPSFTGKRGHVEQAFIFCAAWAFGGHIPRVSGDEPEKGAKKNSTASGYSAAAFSDWWRSEFKGVVFPRGGLVFDYWLDPTSASFTLFSKCHAILEATTHLKETFNPLARTMCTASEVVVPTGDGLAVAYWLRHLLRSNSPALVIGQSGSGKRSCIEAAIAQLEPEHFIPPKSAGSAAISEAKRRALTPLVQSNMISFKSGRDPQVLQLLIRNCLFSNGHGVLGPGSGLKKAVIFLEDVSSITRSGSAVMRRLAETNKLYGPSPQLPTITLLDTTVVASSGLNSPLYHDRGESEGEFARMMRHFSVIYKGAPGAGDITHITQTLLELHFLSQAAFPRALKDSSKLVAAAVSAVHLEICHKLRPSPLKPFFNFNIRHIQRILDGGIMRVDPDVVFNIESLVVVWLHETLRTYADSSCSQVDADVIEKLLLARCSLSFPMVDVSKFFPLKRAAEPLVWSSFADRALDLQEKTPRYKPIPVSLDVTKESLHELIKYYHLTESAVSAAKNAVDDHKLFTNNDMTRPLLPLAVLFDKAIHIILHLVRILGCKAATHLTLVGDNSGGRRSMLKLAAYIVNLEVKAVHGKNFESLVKATLERLAVTRDPLDEEEEKTAEEIAAAAAAAPPPPPTENEEEEDEEEGVAPLALPPDPIMQSILLMVVDDEDAKLDSGHFDSICSLIKGNIPDNLFTMDEKARLSLAVRPSFLAVRRKEVGGSIRGDVLIGLTEIGAAELCWKEFKKRVMRRLRIAVVLEPGADFHPKTHRHANDPKEDTSEGEGSGGLNAVAAIAKHSPEYGLAKTASSKFRSRLNAHPELFQVAALEWIFDWPSDNAVLAILNGAFDKIFVGDVNERRAAGKFYAHVFKTSNELIRDSPKTGLLPRKFGLSCLGAMVQSLESAFMAKRDEIDDLVTRMEKGLKVMAEANSDSEKLKSAVTELQIAASEKQEEYEHLNELFMAEAAKVDRETEKVIDFEGYVNKIWDDAENEREAIVGVLNQCIPFLESMNAQVESLDRADIGMLAKLNKLPHGVVDDVFGGLVVLFAAVNENVPLTKKGKVDDRARSWASARVSLLGNVNAFIDSLRQFKLLIDSGEVPDTNLKDIRRYLVLEHIQRPNDFVEKHSSVAASLATWMVDVVKYSDIIQGVEPKRKVMRKFILQHENAKKRLEIAKESLAQMKLRLGKLEQDAEIVKIQWKRAVQESRRGELRLDLADKLVNILKNEGNIWKKKIQKLEDRRKGMFGDSAYCGAMVHIGAAFDPATRRSLTKGWVPYLETCLQGKALPMSWEVENISDIALSYPTPFIWAAGRGESSFSGVPGRSLLSAEDRNILTSATAAHVTQRVPILIDPEERAMSWLFMKLYADAVEKWEERRQHNAMRYTALSAKVKEAARPSCKASSRPGSKGSSRPGSKESTRSRRSSRPNSRMSRKGSSNSLDANLNLPPPPPEIPKPLPPLVVPVASYKIKKEDGLSSGGESLKSIGDPGNQTIDPKKEIMKGVLKAVKSSACSGRPIILSVNDGDDIDWSLLLPFLNQRAFSRFRLDSEDSKNSGKTIEEEEEEAMEVIMAAMTKIEDDAKQAAAEQLALSKMSAFDTGILKDENTEANQLVVPAAPPEKMTRKQPLDHFLSLSDDDEGEEMFQPSKFWIGVHTTNSNLDALSPRLQAGCTLIHFGASNSFIREAVTDVMLSVVHPPLFNRVCEIIPSIAAKEYAVFAYESRLLEQLLIEEAPPDDEEDEDDDEDSVKVEKKSVGAEDAGAPMVEEDEEETEEEKAKKKRIAMQLEQEKAERQALAGEKKKVPITENRSLIKAIQLTKKGELSARQTLQETVTEHKTLKIAVAMYSPLTVRCAKLFQHLSSLELINNNSRIYEDEDSNYAYSLYAYSLSEHLVMVATALHQAKKFLDQAVSRNKKKKKKKVEAAAEEEKVVDEDKESKMTEAELKREQYLSLLMTGDTSIVLTYDIFIVRLKRYIEAVTTSLLDTVLNRSRNDDALALRASVLLPMIAPLPSVVVSEAERKAKLKRARQLENTKKNKKKNQPAEESPDDNKEEETEDTAIRKKKTMHELEEAELEAIRVGLGELYKLGFGGATIVSPVEVELLCQNAMSDSAEPMNLVMTSLFSERQWRQLAHIEQVIVFERAPMKGQNAPSCPFSHLKTQFQEFALEWDSWIHCSAPERTLMPGPLSDATDFQRLLVVAVLRRDRLSFGLHNFLNSQAARVGHKMLPPRQKPAFAPLVASYLRDKTAAVGSAPAPSSSSSASEAGGNAAGSESAVADAVAPLGYWAAFEHAKIATTVPIRPIFAVYTDGESLLELREMLISFKKAGGLKSDKVNELWYRGGSTNQETVTKELKQAAKTGNRYIFHILAECSHNFFHDMTSIFQRAKASFQIIITCPLQAVEKVPRYLMKMCIRMVDDEAHRQFKTLMRRSWRRIPSEFIDSATLKPVELRSITFATVCLHALLSARNRFKGRGWSTGDVSLGLGYGGGFASSSGDMKLVMNNVKKIVEGEALDWGLARASVFYNLMGGRHRASQFDERALKAHIDSMFRPEVVGKYAVHPGGSALTLPDPNECAGHADYLEYIDQVMVFGLPITSADGELDASTLIFGLDDRCEVASLAGEGRHGTERILDGLGATFSKIFKSLHVPKDTTLNEPASPATAKPVSATGHLSLTWAKNLVERSIDMPPNIDLAALMDRATNELAKPTAPGIMLCFNECSRFNILASLVRTDLAVMRAVLIGTRETNEHVEHQLNCFFVDSSVPHSWQRAAWAVPSGTRSGVSAPDWLEKLSSAGRQLRTWQADLVFPKTIKWGLLFCPWSLPLALKQCAVRAIEKAQFGKGIPAPSMDELCSKLEFTVVTDPNKIPSDNQNRPRPGCCFVNGLFLEGASWPSPSDIQSTPGVTSHYSGGVEGVNGGGWLEPKAGQGSSFSSFKLHQFQALPVALLQCGELLKPAVSLSAPASPLTGAPTSPDGGASVGGVGGIDEEELADLHFQASQHEWRAEAIADLPELKESPPIKDNSFDPLNNTNEGEEKDEENLEDENNEEARLKLEAKRVLDAIKEAPSRIDIPVPVFSSADRSVTILTTSVPAALRKGAVPWGMATPGIFLQTE